MFNLPEITAIFTYALAGVHFLLTILTRSSLGIIQIIPFKIHGIIELIVSLILVGVAFYLGTLEGVLAQEFYIYLALAIFVTWLLTDYGTSNKTGKSIPKQ